jgi:hypothetical protein
MLSELEAPGTVPQVDETPPAQRSVSPKRNELRSTILGLMIAVLVTGLVIFLLLHVSPSAGAAGGCGGV